VKTDSTRAKDLELHIQSRVQQELKRLESEQNAALKDLQDKISAPELAKDGPSSSQKGDQKKQDLGRQSVQKEIDELRKKLGQRKLKEDIVGDKGVEKAKDEVVNCLRVNDRRPLDCWKEVEAFRNEVGRLEKSFLGKVLE
jgi:altered-inheritance-of-mitochondria protein 13